MIARCRARPSEIMARVAESFWEFAPEKLCRFRPAGSARYCERHALGVGDCMEIEVAMAGPCEVRVLHRDAQSLTLGTLVDHPEAGRITFGAYRNDVGDVVFHIRSRARSGSGPLYLGFIAVGEAMQTNTWSDYVNRVALTFGDGVVSRIHAETSEIPDEAPPSVIPIGPTFVARGD